MYDVLSLQIVNHRTKPTNKSLGTVSEGNIQVRKDVGTKERSFIRIGGLGLRKFEIRNTISSFLNLDSILNETLF